jgi:single-stranded-DNA-specific exonuclease RecJ
MFMLVSMVAMTNLLVPPRSLPRPVTSPVKQWVYRFGGPPPALSNIDNALIEAANGSPFLAQLLLSRGVKTVATIKAFLALNDYVPTLGLDLPDMEVGLARISHAIDQQEPILVFGDFDVDGITGTAVLVQTLKHLGAQVTYYIPDRATEGHGLNTSALIRLVSARRLKLVITTDTGITNFNEVSLLKGLGVDTIVTDHHELPENLPPSLANINPKCLPDQSHPLAPLAGVGVAFKLCELLLDAKGADPIVAHSLLDLVAVGTVADLANLHDDNRDLVHRGVAVLNNRKRLGLREILEQAGVPPERPLTSETIGFTIGPRLNALGRLEKAAEAVELLTTDDPERASVIAARLEALNRKRQALCEQTVLEAEQAMRRQGLTIGYQPDDQRAIILASPDWNPGIIGIVASRLIEKYHVPVFLMVVDEAKGEVRASARSIEGFHLYDQLAKLEHYFLHFGGHSGAAGFALKLPQLEAFKDDLYALCQQAITDKMLQPLVLMDAQLSWSQLNLHLLELLQTMAPFGKGNPAPKFLLSGVKVGAQRSLGTDGQHLKLILTDDTPNNSAGIEAMMWRAGQRERFDTHQCYDFVVSPEVNTFNGQSKLQLIIEADRLSQGKGLANSRMGHSLRTDLKPLDSSQTVQPTIDTTDVSPLSNSVWLDHRQRVGLDQFVSELLLLPSSNANTRSCLYHEGQAPQLAALRPNLVCTRHSVWSTVGSNQQPDKPTATVETLIMWDLPPDAPSLARLIKTLQPNTIHWAGGKYQTVPVYPNDQAWLKLLNQTLRRMANPLTDAPFWLDASQLALQLATVSNVIVTGLLALQRVGLANVLIPNDAQAEVFGDGGQLWVKPLPVPDALDMETLAQSIEWVAFKEALKAVGHYRDWLLHAPLSAIKASLAI